LLEETRSVRLFANRNGLILGRAALQRKRPSPVDALAARRAFAFSCF
jgi:hypothetical protein